MRQSWKSRLRNIIRYDTLLLRFPFLYETKYVFYETELKEDFNAPRGIDDLLSQMAMVLNVEGEIIECGSARCGTSVIMANYLRAQHINKKILACDSFEGFDRAELEQEQKAGITTVLSNDYTFISYSYVQKKIATLRLQDIVVPIKGYFQDSLPTISGPFCLALIDCDLRDSVLYSAEAIWPKLSSRGRILFDDAFDNPMFRGAKQGVDRFIENHRAEISEHGLLNRLYYACKA